MTTTNIAGIAVPDWLIVEAASVATALDAIRLALLPTLDRATDVMTQLEMLGREESFGARTDEQIDGMINQTPLGRLYDHFTRLHDRTVDRKELGPEYHRAFAAWSGE